MIPEDKPMVIRAEIEGLAEDGLAVGYPGGFNFVFDVRKSQLIAKWQGRFLGFSQDRNVTGSQPLIPLITPGNSFKTAAMTTPYKGYRIRDNEVTIICGNDTTQTQLLLTADGRYQTIHSGAGNAKP